MILHSDWSYIEQEFECGLRDRFLMPVRSFDNARSVAPFILEARNQRTALLVHVERGNADAAYLPPSFNQVFYRPYFTFNQDDSRNVRATLADAIRDLASGDRSLTVDAKLPMAVVAELEAAFEVSFEDVPELGSVTLKRIAPADVISKLAIHRRAAGHAASILLERSPVRDLVLPYLEVSAPDRFARLDAFLASETIDALVLTTRLNMQEVAGVPMRAKSAPLAALYLPGGAIWAIEEGTGQEGRSYPSLRVALGEICSNGRIGCEKDDIGFGLFSRLGLHLRATAAADDLLRRWRDHGTLPDLPFYVIATRASATATEAALRIARQGVDAGRCMTEMDAYTGYFTTLHAAVAELMPDLRVGKTLTNFHSGARTIFPANAAAAPLSTSSNMLKLDTGCLLFDSTGILLGCSDIARTLTFSVAGDEMYELLKHGVRDVLVPACKAGASGAEIHAAGVSAVWGQPTKALSNPLFVDLTEPITDYKRDVGHLLGKNNLSHLTFTSHTHEKLVEGMIACCEYQWPVASHAIAYEDTCLVTPSGGLNLTSDEA